MPPQGGRRVARAVGRARTPSASSAWKSICTASSGAARSRLGEASRLCRAGDKPRVLCAPRQHVSCGRPWRPGSPRRAGHNAFCARAKGARLALAHRDWGVRGGPLDCLAAVDEGPEALAGGRVGHGVHAARVPGLVVPRRAPAHPGALAAPDQLGPGPRSQRRRTIPWRVPAAPSLVVTRASTSNLFQRDGPRHAASPQQRYGASSALLRAG